VAKVIRVRHSQAALFALSFGCYHAFLGLINFEQYEMPIPAAAGLILYVVVLFLSTRFTRALRLPYAIILFALLSAVVVPALEIYAIDARANYEYHTWFVAGIGTVMAVLAWRNHTAAAWTGTIAMAVTVYALGGSQVFLNSGMTGSFALVAASQGLAIALKSAQKSSGDFLDWRMAVNLDTKNVSVSRAGSQLRLLEALDSSLPLLRLIQEQQGKISSSDSKKLLLAEAGIRDQIRAKGFQDRDLVAAVLSARTRGIEVQVSDDGGIDLLEIEEKNALFSKLVQTLDAIKVGRVVIRSVAGETWTVSLFSSGSSESSNNIFLRL